MSGTVSQSPVMGTFSAAGTGTPMAIRFRDASINVTIGGTFTGSIRPIRSFDGGLTWVPVTYIDGSPIVWTGPLSTVAPEPEAGVQWALEALSGFSGTANWRLSQ